MSQTGPKTTEHLEMYRQSSAPFNYTMSSFQFSNNYSYGEVGVNVSGGTAGSAIKADSIDIDSYLSGRDRASSRFSVPNSSLDKINFNVKSIQPIQVNNNSTKVLVPLETREKKSGNDLSAIDYNRWQPNLMHDPQDPKFVLGAFASQRGGLNTKTYSKEVWNAQVKGSNLKMCDSKNGVCKFK